MALQLKPKTNKPVLHTGNQQAANPPQPQNTVNNTQNNTVDQSKPVSTNVMFGLQDVPQSERSTTIPIDEYNKKLDRGELVYGLVPQVPTIPAIDNISFDYCDGLRVWFGAPEKGAIPPKYHIIIKDEELGSVVCNEVVEVTEAKCIATIQKYFTHFGFTVVRLAGLPQDLGNKIMQHYNISQIHLQMIYEGCCLPDITQSQVEEGIFRNCYAVTFEDRSRYAQAIRDVLTYIKENHTFHHSFDPKDKEVIIQFPVSTIGDSIGWFSYMERFQEKTQCKLICVMNPLIYCLFEKHYPNIKFIEAKDTRNYKPYANYNMGLFFKANTTQQPYDFRYIGNGRTVSKIIDVDDTDIPPRCDLSAPRRIKEPYVCIATNGSAYCKLWTHPSGWQTVIDHLRKIGYRIICIDKDKSTGAGVVINYIPWGVEDETGDKPLQERLDLLKDCDFFICVSSGLSWLAWCAKCPVVMISGFTNPFNEYYTPYRVINPFACHGCWNDETCDFDHYDYMWCPKHKNTPRAYECSKMITPEHVLNVISRIPAYQEMKKKYDAEHVEEVDPYLENEIPMPEVVAEVKQEIPQQNNITIPSQTYEGAVINIQ